jgi:catechol 2,3-dioxygenase-like lactoylglutathione lyase family enzyme
MLLNGLNHVAVMTSDSDRLHAFYRDVFDARVVEDSSVGPGMRLSFVEIGPHTQLNVFQIEGNDEAHKRLPVFARGRLDHLAVQAASLEAFEAIRDRMIACGATDGFVTDFGEVLSLFFTDPDGLECEVCIENPDMVPGVRHPPGTPAARYHS